MERVYACVLCRLLRHHAAQRRPQSHPCCALVACRSVVGRGRRRRGGGDGGDDESAERRGAFACKRLSEKRVTFERSRVGRWEFRRPSAGTSSSQRAWAGPAVAGARWGRLVLGIQLRHERVVQRDREALCGRTNCSFALSLALSLARALSLCPFPLSTHARTYMPSCLMCRFNVICMVGSYSIKC